MEENRYAKRRHRKSPLRDDIDNWHGKCNKCRRELDAYEAIVNEYEAGPYCSECVTKDHVSSWFAKEEILR